MRNRLHLFVTLFVLTGVMIYFVFTGNSSLAKFERENINANEKQEVKSAKIQEAN